MYKLDLHTHSQASPDGGLTAEDYRRMLASSALQGIAITDHNRIDFAERLRAELGDEIIVGEEIAAQEGELIGLYLQRAVPAGLTALETARRIHRQGGLTYVPHPFETQRKGLPLDILNQIAQEVDIVETYNGRTLQNRAGQAGQWANTHSVPGASSSDAHGRRGWSNTYSLLAEKPTRETLVQLLHIAEQHTGSTGALGRLYPMLNRLKKEARHA